MSTARETLAKWTGGLSGFTTVATVLTLPWLLGGVLPLARLVLLCGSVLAASLALASSLLAPQGNRRIPLICLPLVGLAALGLFQLRSVDQHQATHMKHALRDTAQLHLEETTSAKASLAPDRTRTNIAMYLSLAMLSIVAASHLNSPKAIALSATAAIVSGTVMTGIGVPLLFQEHTFSLNDPWTFGETLTSGARPFATFINPNNGAGWLLLTFSITAGAVIYMLQRRDDRKGTPAGLHDSGMESLIHKLGTMVAELTTWQVLALALAVSLGAGVMATQSRGAMAALAGGIVVTAALNVSWKRWPLVVLLLVIAFIPGFLLLQSLGLTGGIADEIGTLNSLDAAAGIRPQLWRDSLNVARDFPMTGTGLGSFQFAILPYQSQDQTDWFRFADNQYVDMLVDGGVVGLLLFVSVGLCGVLTWQSTLTLRKARNREQRKQPKVISRRLTTAGGIAVLMGAATQGVAALFDYGIAMPAAASLLVVLLASVAGHVADDPRVADWRKGVLKFGKTTHACGLLFVMAASICFVGDQIASTRIDTTLVKGNRLLSGRHSPAKFDRLAEVRAELEKQIASRPDDSDALWLLTRLSAGEFRWLTLQRTYGEQIRDYDDFNRTWKRSRLEDIVKFQGQVRSKKPGLFAREFKQNADNLKKTRLKEHAFRQAAVYPLMPKLSVVLASVAALQDKSPQVAQYCERADFVEPAVGVTQWKLGLLASRNRLEEAAFTYWNRSRATSDEFQAVILADAIQLWGEEKAMTRFAPTSFVSRVRSAAATGADLRKSLLEMAEQQWQEITDPTESQYSARSQQVLLQGDQDAAVKALETGLDAHRNSQLLIKDYARLLQKQKRYNSAADQWDRLLFLSPGDEEAEFALDEIEELRKKLLDEANE